MEIKLKIGHFFVIYWKKWPNPVILKNGNGIFPLWAAKRRVKEIKIPCESWKVQLCFPMRGSATSRPCGGDDFILRSKYEKTLDWKCIAKVRLSSESEKYIYVFMYLLKEEKCKSNNESSHLIIAWSSNSVSLCMESSLWNNRLRHLTSKRVMKKKGNLQIAHSEPETKISFRKYKITNTPKCKNLRSGWLQTLLYQESTTWSKNRGVNLMRPQNVACNTCRGTRWGFP